MTVSSPSAPRSARDVIDQAIRENRSWERLCFAFVVGLLLAGAAILLQGIVSGEGVVVASGAAVAALFWRPLRYAIEIRAANMRIRLFELALSVAKNGKEAASLIRDAMKPNVTQQKGKR